MKTSIIYLIFNSILFQSHYANRTIDLNDTKLVVCENHKTLLDSKLVKSKLEIVNENTISALKSNSYKDITIPKINEIKVTKNLTFKNIGFEMGSDLVVVGLNIEW